MNDLLWTTAAGHKISGTATKFVYVSATNETVTLTGTGFHYDVAGILTAGAITGISSKSGGVNHITWTGLGYSATDFSLYAFGLISGNKTQIAADFLEMASGLKAGADKIYDTASSHDVYGEAGNDTIYGGGGNDWLYGGRGQDRYYGGAGTDYVAFRDAMAVVSVDLRLTSNQIKNDGFGNVETAVGVENWSGGDNGNKMIADNTSVTFYGGDGVDTLTGGAGHDTIWGGDGVDRLSGGGNYDVLYMWVSDQVAHGVSVDLRKTAGQVLNDGYGNVETVLGFEDIWGSAYSDRLIGGAGSNYIWADAGADTIFGDGGNDTLVGSAGNDSLYGGGGNDVLWGDSGRNLLSGGAGADVFKFNDHLGDTANLRQTVTDFQHGIDRIDLDTDLGGFTGEGALSNAQFRSGAGFTSAVTADQRIIYNTTSGVLYLDIDGAGGKAAVQIGLFSNHAALAASDFWVYHLT